MSFGLIPSSISRFAVGSTTYWNLCTPASIYLLLYATQKIGSRPEVVFPIKLILPLGAKALFAIGSELPLPIEYLAASSSVTSFHTDKYFSNCGVHSYLLPLSR